MFELNREQRMLAMGLLISIGVGSLIYLVRGYLPTEKETFNTESTQLPILHKVIQPQKTILVHVTGQVLRPGVYRLLQGDRVLDAVQLAGGVTVNADISRLRLAASLRDGQSVYAPIQRSHLTSRPFSNTGQRRRAGKDGYKRVKKENLSSSSPPIQIGVVGEFTKKPRRW